MNLSGHEDRRTLQRYLHPSKEGTHRRLDELGFSRGRWALGAEDIATRLAAPDTGSGGRERAASGQQRAEPESFPPATAGARAIAPGEHVNPDTVRLDRSPETGVTLVFGMAGSGEGVLVGFLDRCGRQWHAHGSHMSRIPGHWRTRQEALLRLVEPHAGG